MKKLILALMVLMMVEITYAGFTSDYLPDNEFRMGRYENGTFRIGLQNLDEYPIKVTIAVSSNDIETMIRDTQELEGEYEVPPGTKAMPVYVDIFNPGNVTIGDRFHMSYRVGNKVLNEEAGIIQLGSAISKSFDIVIVSKYLPKFYNTPYFYNTTIGQKIIYKFNCSDEENDVMTYGTNFTEGVINEDTGVYTWRPFRAGTYEIPITCSDGADEATVEFEVTVERGFLVIAIGATIILLVVGIAGLLIARGVKRGKQEEQNIEF